MRKHIATSIGFEDVASVNASFPAFPILAPSEHWNTEEINDGTYLIPGLRVPAGSNPASVIELLNRIAGLILKHPHTEDIRGSLAPWRVRRIVTHVNANLDAALRVEDLARLTRLSLSHFCRAFRSSFGCPPHRFITHCRLERAKELMLRTDVPLLQIAIECGFADQPHFSRVFLRFVGISPARWRRVLAAPPQSHVVPTKRGEVTVIDFDAADCNERTTHSETRLGRASSGHRR